MSTTINSTAGRIVLTPDQLKGAARSAAYKVLAGRDMNNEDHELYVALVASIIFTEVALAGIKIERRQT